jgi:putative Holliday junction resolvase
MILGVDPGGARVGLAVGDIATGWARPLEVVERARADPIARISELVIDLDIRLIVVGRPVGLAGHAGPAVVAQQEFVATLRAAVPVAVTEFDERLTTVVAEQGLRAGGAKAATRRRLKDAVAAQVMLQGYLDSMP